MYNTVHWLFEQTNTFRDTLTRMAPDMLSISYDIDGNPSFKCDLFLEIDKYYQGLPSIFEDILSTDLVVAFFPCTYFSGFNKPMVSMTADIRQYKDLNPMLRAQTIARRVANFATYYSYICKLIGIAQTKGFHLVIENPAHTSFLNDFTPCDTFFIDYDRTKHGDFFKKPTFFFFVNKTLPFGFNNDNCYLDPSKRKSITHENGMLNRSTISIRYAEWFIKNIVLDDTIPYEDLFE